MKKKLASVDERFLLARSTKAAFATAGAGAGAAGVAPSYQQVAT